MRPESGLSELGEAFCLRIGIVCTDRGLMPWQQRCVDCVRRLDFVDLGLIIVDCDSRSTPAHAVTGALFKPKALYVVGLTDSLRDIPVVESPAGQSVWVIARQSPLDLVLYFADEAVPQELVATAPFDVWRFHFGNSAGGYRHLPCLQEICVGDDVINVRLLMQTDDGGVRVLREAVVKTIKYSYQATLGAALSAAEYLPAQACIELRNAAWRELPCKPVLPGPVRAQTPTTHTIPTAVGKMLKSRISWLIDGVSLGETWTLGVVEKPIERCLEKDFLDQVSFLPIVDPARYLADGFGLDLDQRRLVMCEHYDYKIGKGTIVWLELDSEATILAGPHPAMEIPEHASFPYLFRHDERLFCCPENAKSGALVLWEAIDPPASWRPCCELLADVPAIDPVIFRFEGLWWLFCSRQDDQPDTMLYAWHAESLEGPWRPHDLNPVKIDVRSARSAGTPFWHEGMLFRPAQDCSRTYGGRIVINRVTRLSPVDFVEETAGIIDPPQRSGFAAGIHTISSFGKHTLVDVKREQFNRADLVWKARKRVRMLFTRQ